MIQFNRHFIAGTIVGFGAGVAFRSLMGEHNSVRDIAKSALKGAIATFHKFKERAGHFKENLEDLSAEVKSEIRAEHASRMAEQKGKTNGARKTTSGINATIH